MESFTFLKTLLGPAFFPLIVLLVSSWAFFAIGIIVVPVMALADCRRNRAEAGRSSIIWAVVILLTWTLGAVVYGLSRKNNKALLSLSAVSIILAGTSFFITARMLPLAREKLFDLQTTLMTTPIDRMTGPEGEILRRELAEPPAFPQQAPSHDQSLFEMARELLMRARQGYEVKEFTQ